jgi:predicted transposase/invertase (TIGR01784 family)
LLVEPETTVIKEAKTLIERAPEHLNFIERVFFYKFKDLSRKEILKMLSIREEFEEELKKTRAYQEILQEGRQEGLKEGKLRAVAFLRELSVSDEVIAERSELPLDEVKKVQSKQ